MRRLLIGLAVAVVLVGCAGGSHGVDLGPSHERLVRVTPHFAPHPVKGMVELQAPRATLRVAVAADKFTLTHGLAGRRSLSPHTGMLFVAPWRGDHLLSMWMKDTYIPVDMVFISNAGVVTGIAPNVPPGAPHAPDYRIARRFGHGHYVVEIPAGEALRDGIASGTRFAIPRFVAAS